MTGSTDVGEILSALGNHEAKALMYLAMDPDDEYGITALHRLFLAMQGHEPVFKGTVTLQQKYCIWSFEPAGLVQRVTNERGHIRHVKTDPEGKATALAGHLLAATEGHPASLSQIFGKTATREQPGLELERTPVRRLAVMRAVLAESGPTHQADLARRTGIRELTIGHNAEALARAGLLQYRTAPTYAMKSRYMISAPAVAGGRGNNALKAVIVDYLNDRLAQHRGQDLIITRDEIEAHVRAIPRWQTAARLRDMVQRLMVLLAKQGQVTPVTAFAGQNHHTVVDTDPAQRAFLERVVVAVDRVAAGDRTALIEGEKQAMTIVNDTSRVCALLAKGFGSNKNIVNPITQAEKRRRVLAQLAVTEAVTSEHLTTMLSPDMTKHLVRGTLRELANEGLVRGEKQPDGPYNLWYLNLSS